MLANVAINTRENCEGRLFVALNGENFDAHDYVFQAESAGASALMVEKEVETNLPYILVNSTHQALKDLAAWWRSQFDIPVIGIGAGAGTDAQVLVMHDLLGLSGHGARFVENFMEGQDTIQGALKAFVDAVKSGEYPREEHSYT